MKLTYSVDIPSHAHPVNECGGTNGQWTDLYSNPDPALLLPYRWTDNGLDDNGQVLWGLTPDHSRQQLKSLFIENVNEDTQETTDPNSPVYDKLATAPNAGAQVRLSLPVYNFSVGSPAQNVTVNFSYVPVSSSSDPGDAHDNEWSCGTPTGNGYVCPDSTRSQLKNQDGTPVQVVISSIPAWGDPGNPNWQMATAVWTIPTSMANTKYRIYVDLAYGGTGANAETNPPQAPCTKGPCQTLCPTGTNAACLAPSPTVNTDPLAPGQNNEGYRDFQIGPTAQTTAATAIPIVDVHTAEDSLVAINEGHTCRRLVLGQRGRPIKLRVKAVADGWDARHIRVLVTDQQLFSKKAPTGIAEKILQGVGTQGSTAFFSWTPQKTGVHLLRATVKEMMNDKQKGNNTAQLFALILRARGDINGDGVVDSSDLTFIEQDNGKPVLASACGFACDLNGDGFVTKARPGLASVDVHSRALFHFRQSGTSVHQRRTVAESVRTNGTQKPERCRLGGRPRANSGAG